MRVRCAPTTASLRYHSNNAGQNEKHTLKKSLIADPLLGRHHHLRTRSAYGFLYLATNKMLYCHVIG